MRISANTDKRDEEILLRKYVNFFEFYEGTGFLTRKGFWARG